jgi:hypothetical protein
VHWWSPAISMAQSLAKNWQLYWRCYVGPTNWHDQFTSVVLMQVLIFGLWHPNQSTGGTALTPRPKPSNSPSLSIFYVCTWLGDWTSYRGTCPLLCLSVGTYSINNWQVRVKTYITLYVALWEPYLHGIAWPILSFIGRTKTRKIMPFVRLCTLARVGRSFGSEIIGHFISLSSPSRHLAFAQLNGQ